MYCNGDYVFDLIVIIFKRNIIYMYINRYDVTLEIGSWLERAPETRIVKSNYIVMIHENAFLNFIPRSSWTSLKIAITS